MKFRNLLFKLSLAAVPVSAAATAAEPLRQAVATADAPAAKGPYSQAIRYGGLLFLAGQVPVDPKTNEWVAGDIETQTRLVMNNIQAILAANGMSMANVLSTTVYLKDFADFPKMNAVYAGYFKEVAPPARTTVPAPLGGTMLIEISAIAGR